MQRYLTQDSLLTASFGSLFTSTPFHGDSGDQFLFRLSMTNSSDGRQMGTDS